MKTPFQRAHRASETRHHLFFEKPEWNATEASKRVRELGSFVIGIRRAPHDYLHRTMDSVAVPVKPVLDAVYELGREYVGHQNDSDRLERILDGMTGYAKSVRSPEQADGMWSLATTISAQLAIAEFWRGAKPRYE